MVLFQCSVESSRKDGKHRRGRDRRSERKDEGDARDDTGHETAETTADRKQPKDQFNRSSAECHHVSNEHPFRHRLVRIQCLVQITGKNILDIARATGGAVQSPHRHRIECELGFGLRAIVDFVFAGTGLVARAVTPEADVVEIANFVFG